MPLRLSRSVHGQRDDNALWSADIAEAVEVLVVRDFANQLRAVAFNRSTTSSICSTANMMRRIPSTFGAVRSGATAVGDRKFVSSGRLFPSGVFIIAISTWTPSSPTTASTQDPSTGICTRVRVPARRRTRSRRPSCRPQFRHGPSVRESRSEHRSPGRHRHNLEAGPEPINLESTAAPRRIASLSFAGGLLHWPGRTSGREQEGVRSVR